MPGERKSLVGTVVSDKMDKTVVVLVERTMQHRLYRKILKRSKRFLAHDDRLDAKAGDLVRIMESRPLSRHKRWRVAEILQRGEVAEVAPREIDSEYLGRPKEREAEPAEAPAAEAPAAEPVSEEPVAELAAEAPEAEAPVEEREAESAPPAAAAEAPDAEAGEAVPEAEAPVEEAEAEKPLAEAEEEPSGEEPLAQEEAGEGPAGETAERDTTEEEEEP